MELRVLVLLSVLITLSAQALEIIHEETGEVILKADTCEELSSHVDAIRQWTERKGEIPPQFHKDCKENKTLIDIYPYLPSTIKKIYNVFPVCEGPNCFNAALIGAGLLKNQRYVEGVEYGALLTQHCKKRSQSEKPQPGDLIAIRKKIDASHFIETHGFTMLNETLSCSKNGYITDSSCILQPFSSVLKEYGVPDDQKCFNPDNIPPSDCNVFINYFDCSIKSDPPLEEAVVIFDAMLSRCTMSGDFSEFENLLKKFESIKHVLEKNQIISYEQGIKTLKNVKNSSLIIPIRNGDIGQVNKLIQKENINLLGEDGSPLYEAVQKKNFEIVKLLLSKGADPNLFSQVGKESPVLLSIRLGDFNIFKLLVNRGANINLCSVDGVCPIHLAMDLNQKNMVKYLLRRSEINLKVIDKNLQNPLMKMTLNRDIDLIKILIENHEDMVNHVDHAGWSALMLAAEKGHFEIVKLFVQKGAQLEIANSFGYTALFSAISSGDPKVVQFLLENKANPNPLRYSIETPLTYSVLENKIDITKLLLKYGADPRITNHYHESILALSILYDQVDFIEYHLLKNKLIDINQVDKNQWSPLMRAVFYDRIEIFNLLINNDANIEIRNNSGLSALDIAIYYGKLNFVKALLRLNATVSEDVFKLENVKDVEKSLDLIYKYKNR